MVVLITFIHVINLPSLPLSLPSLLLQSQIFLISSIPAPPFLFILSFFSLLPFIPINNPNLQNIQYLQQPMTHLISASSSSHLCLFPI